MANLHDETQNEIEACSRIFEFSSFSLRLEFEHAVEMVRHVSIENELRQERPELGAVRGRHIRHDVAVRDLHQGQGGRYMEVLEDRRGVHYLKSVGVQRVEEGVVESRVPAVVYQPCHKDCKERLHRHVILETGPQRNADRGVRHIETVYLVVVLVGVVEVPDRFGVAEERFVVADFDVLKIEEPERYLLRRLT